MSEIVVNETWIVNQLAGIRKMEQKLSVAMAKPSRRASLQREVARLNAWINLVDYALSVRGER